MNNDIEQIILENDIDVSKLERDYIVNPIIVSKNPKKTQIPSYNDLKYIYKDINLHQKTYSKIFWCKFILFKSLVENI